MSNIKTRINRLERSLNTNGKYFLYLGVPDGMTAEEVLDNELKEMGLTLDDIGYVSFIGNEFGIKYQDYGNHDGLETLIGYKEHMEWFKNFLDEIDGKSVGPPSERNK